MLDEMHGWPDASRPVDPVIDRLQAIAAELWNLLNEAHDAAIGGVFPNDDARATVDTPGDHPRDYSEALIVTVEQEYARRRMRDKVFGAEMFGEPAWDMLLYLYAAHLRGDLVATNSLARASAVPATTALRWIAQLEAAGLIERSSIERDGRVRVLRLTRSAAATLELHFRRCLAVTNRGPTISAVAASGSRRGRKPRDAARLQFASSGPAEAELIAGGGDR